MLVAPRKTGLLQAGGLLREVAGRGPGGSSSGRGACRSPPRCPSPRDGLREGGLTGHRGPHRRREKIWVMPCTGFLIIKLNYCELSDNFKISGINVKTLWQRFHQFFSPFPGRFRLKIQTHPQNRGKFPNSGSPCTPWTSAQA